MLSRAAAAPEGASTTAVALHVPSWLPWASAVAITCTYLCTLGHFALSEPDEARYAEIAREMLELGDWVTPHLNYVKYFEKPPLVYWLTSVNVALFGASEFVVRLWPALLGLLGIYMAYALSRSIYGTWSGYVAAAVLASTPLYFGMSQFLVLDMPLSSLMALGLGSFWFAYQSPEHRRRFVMLLYLATALGVLTKGPVAALLTGSIIALFVILRRDWTVLRWLASPAAIASFIVITVPWFVLVSRRNPEFVNFFFIKQHLGRFLTPDEHRQSIWFFVPIILVGMLPWTLLPLLAPDTLSRFTRRLLRTRVATGTLFCAIWSGFVFAFFSASGSKLGTYILPMFCPLSVLASRLLRQLVGEGRDRPFIRASFLLLALAALVALATLLAGEFLDIPNLGVVISRIYWGAGILGASSAAALIAARRRALQASLLILVVGMLLLQLVAVGARNAASQYRPLGSYLRTHAAPADRIVMYRHYTQGVVYYGQRRAILDGGRGELDFGSRQGDLHAFFWDTDAQLFDAWRAGGHLFLVINRSELEPLSPHLQPAPRQVAAQGKKVIVVNFP